MYTKRTTGWHATVSVRVPRDGPDSLAECARRRLESATDVRAVDVTTVQGIEPALAATVVTVRVSVRMATELDDEDVSQLLAAAPGSQRVDDVTPT